MFVALTTQLGCSSVAFAKQVTTPIPVPITNLMQLQLSLRLAMATICGASIGWERASANHSVGIRTLALVSLGAAAFTICSQYGFAGRADASRMASSVVSGVGFIGAGVITIAKDAHKSIVHGMTTAAAVWMSAATGLACGCGLHIISVACVVLTIAVLRLDRVTKKSFKVRVIDDNIQQEMSEKRYGRALVTSLGNNTETGAANWRERKVANGSFSKKVKKLMIDTGGDHPALAKKRKSENGKSSSKDGNNLLSP